MSYCFFIARFYAKTEFATNIFIYLNCSRSFCVKSSNKETVGHSQGYTTKANCKSGINAVIKACKYAEIIDTTKEDYVSAVGRATFEVYRDNEMKFRFRLIAANTANILASQGYTAKSNCLNGIKAVKAICLNHNVEDSTLIKK